MDGLDGSMDWGWSAYSLYESTTGSSVFINRNASLKPNQKGYIASRCYIIVVGKFLVEKARNNTQDGQSKLIWKTFLCAITAMTVRPNH